MAKKKKNNSRPINEMPVEAIVTRELPVIETGTDENYFSYAEQKCINYTYAKHQLYKRTDEKCYTCRCA